MRVLIAILGCHKDKDNEQAQRETCFANVGTSPDNECDIRFFVGRPNLNLKEDEVFVDVEDYYDFLPFKTQALCKWALDHPMGYDFLFKADTDTYIHVPRLLRSGFEAYDYSGFYRGPEIVEPGGYASGGSGYWLSRRAMQLVVDGTMQQNQPYCEEGCKFHPGGHAITGHYLHGEDLQVGRIMKDAGILVRRDFRYCLNHPGPRKNNDVITLHDVKQPCKADRMRDIHAEYLNS